MTLHAPIAQEYGALFGEATLPPGFRYLLVLRKDALGRRLKPMAFNDLGHLARHLTTAATAAEAGGIKLCDQELLFHGLDQVRAGVSCWVLEPATGEPRDFLGWAWLNGAGRDTLTAALQRARPEARA